MAVFDLDKAFIRSMLKDGREAYLQAMEKGVRAEYLQGAGLTAWNCIMEHYQTYDEFPHPDIVQGKTGVDLGPLPPGTSEFFADELLKRRLHLSVSAQLSEVIKFIEAKDPHKAYEAYADGLRILRGERIGTTRVVSLPAQGAELLAHYDRMKAGERGIQTPWPSVNEHTFGFWPEDFILYVARLGIGKTWTLILLMMHIWQVEKKKVLFVSTEMNQLRILQRAYAVLFRLQYKDLSKGRLGEHAEAHFREQVHALMNAEGLDIIGGDFDFTIESMEAAIEESEPDICLVDGAYLLRVGGEGRTEKAANAFDELKRTAKRNKIPIVATTQFNREAKANKAESVSVEKIALSDAAGWNADMIYGLVQTDDMRLDNTLVQKPLKIREGVGEDVECNWDFDTMDFSEKPSAEFPGGTGGGENPLPATGSGTVSEDELPF
jgi:hypothetical protein